MERHIGRTSNKRLTLSGFVDCGCFTDEPLLNYLNTPQLNTMFPWKRRSLNLCSLVSRLQFTKVALPIYH